MYTDFSKMAQQLPAYDTFTFPKENDNAVTLSLTENEQSQLATWNDTQQDFPQNMCIPQLVAERAATTPDALALIMGDEELSYMELNRRANQFAHYLQTLGVGPNVL